MYQLKTTSNSARFYSWIWNTDVSSYKTMCPYFWGYLLTVLFLPLILLGKGFYYLLPAKKKVHKAFDSISESKLGDFANRIFKPNGFWDLIYKGFKWILISVLSAVILVWLGIIIYEIYQNLLVGLYLIGILGFIIGITILVAYLHEEYELWKKVQYPFKLIGNMVYSLYKNFCPLIKWN